MVTTLASRFGQLKELPTDWRTGRIADHAIIKTGSRNTQDRIDDGKYPFFVRSQIVERINDFSFNGEAVLTAGDGVGTGKVFHYINGPFDCHQRVYRITDFSSELDGYYFYLYFSNHFYDRIMSMTAKSSVDSVRMEMIADMQIPLPPLPEQRAIAQALSDADDLIQSLERLIAKKRDLKQATMQQLLTGQTRLPGFSGEWAATRLGDLGETYGGLAGKTKEDFGEGNARYITFLNVMMNSVLKPGLFEPVRVSASENQNRAAAGDLFFNGSSETPEEVGMCSLLTEDHEDLYLNSFCFGFRLFSNAGTDGLYLAFFLRSSEGRRLMYSLAQGATRYNLSKTALKNIVFPLPCRSEQAAIAEVLSDMDAEIDALEARLTKTRDLKQGMMQELLTGRTRLV